MQGSSILVLIGALLVVGALFYSFAPTVQLGQAPQSAPASPEQSSPTSSSKDSQEQKPTPETSQQAESSAETPKTTEPPVQQNLAEPPKTLEPFDLIKTNLPVMVTNGIRHVVPLEEILSGGVPRDGIPSIDRPKFISVAQTDFLADNDLVLGIYHEGVARAYPHKILVWHEIVNDVVAGTPFSVTYCPLCYTGTAHIRKIGGETVEYGVSGLLHNSDLVMYDRKTNTLWSQIMGTGIRGELAGYKLIRVPLDTMKWKDWRALHPDTEVLSTETGWSRPYGTDPYGRYGYYTNEDIWFPVKNFDRRLKPKEIIWGIEIDGKTKAYIETKLADAAFLNDVFGGKEILVYSPAVKVARFFDRNLNGQVLDFELRQGKLYDKQTGSEWNPDGIAVNGKLKGQQLTRIPAIPNFWFAWVAFYPNTELWGV